MLRNAKKKPGLLVVGSVVALNLVGCAGSQNTNGNRGFLDVVGDRVGTALGALGGYGVAKATGANSDLTALAVGGGAVLGDGIFDEIRNSSKVSKKDQEAVAQSRPLGEKTWIQLPSGNNASQQWMQHSSGQYFLLTTEYAGPEIVNATISNWSFESPMGVQRASAN